MTHGDSLVLTVEATQQSIQHRFQEAVAPHLDPHRPRDDYAAIDAFLAATSRHMAAAEGVLVARALRMVPAGQAPTREYLAAARQLELTLALVKARLYGETHARHLSWPLLWQDVAEHLADHNRMERLLVDSLVTYGDPAQVDGLAQQLFVAEVRAPTRPHPWLPHTGRLSPVARRIWAVADRFWDLAEGRLVPDPVRPAQHRHDSLLAQYLVADPMFNGHAELWEHRHRHHPDGGPGEPPAADGPPVSPA